MSRELYGTIERQSGQLQRRIFSFQKHSSHYRKPYALVFDGKDDQKKENADVNVGKLVQQIMLPLLFARSKNKGHVESDIYLCIYEEISSNVEIQCALTNGELQVFTSGDDDLTGQEKQVHSLHVVLGPEAASDEDAEIQNIDCGMSRYDIGECLEFLSFSLTQWYSSQNYNPRKRNTYLVQPSHVISKEDVFQVIQLTSKILTSQNTPYDKIHPIRQSCSCQRKECIVDEVLYALDDRYDWRGAWVNDCKRTIQSCYKHCHDVMASTLRVCLTECLPQQSISKVGKGHENVSTTFERILRGPYTSQFIHHNAKLFSSIPSDIKIPLISITLCPEVQENNRYDIMTNPLLRACVKRLLIGRVLLHSNGSIPGKLYSSTSIKSCLEVRVPSSNDSSLSVSLHYRVYSIQSNEKHIAGSQNGYYSPLYVILYSTSILFQLSQAQVEREKIDENLNTVSQLLESTVLSPISSINLPLFGKSSQCSYRKSPPPFHHLLESLRMVIFSRTYSRSYTPLIPRSFLLTGPPGVGKTYSVKQAIKMANSWLASISTAESNIPSESNSKSLIRLISIRGSELLATAASSGGHYATAAQELGRAFYAAARMCQKTVNETNTDEGQTITAKILSGEADEVKAVVIFLDECDALVSSSIVVSSMLAMLLDLVDRGRDTEGNDGWQFLLVVAATNRVDAIPSFLRRPGRLEKELILSPPNAEERFSLLKGMLESSSASCMSDSTEISTAGSHRSITEADLLIVAESCVGYVAADLSALLRRAALLSMERNFRTERFTRSNIISLSDILTNDMFDAMRDVGASCLRDAFISAPPKTTWDDIAGDVGGAKEALRRAIEWPQTHKAAFKALALSPPRGVLLHGPPGCAKTTLARAAAGSAGVAFLSFSPADVYSSSYVGEAERVVRRAFDLARSAAPCVLFFDEIDSIIGGDDGSTSGYQGSGMGRGSSAEARVLSTFLNEMDGVDGAVEDGVLVLGATNRPGTLDAALLRPGRFDKVIYVPQPDELVRKEILIMECNKWKNAFINSSKMNFMSSPSSDDLCQIFNISLLASDAVSGNMTGAEVVGACRESAMKAMSKIMRYSSWVHDNELSEDLADTLLNTLKNDLEATLRQTQPLLSDPKIKKEYTQ